MSNASGAMDCCCLVGDLPCACSNTSMQRETTWTRRAEHLCILSRHAGVHRELVPGATLTFTLLAGVSILQLSIANTLSSFRPGTYVRWAALRLMVAEQLEAGREWQVV